MNCSASKYIKALEGIDPGTSTWDKQLAFVNGYIEGVSNFGGVMAADICYRELSWFVASRLGLAPYFRCKEVIDRLDGALVRYEQDFYKIDFEVLCCKPDVPFVFIVRDYGTHLYFTDMEQYLTEGIDAVLSPRNSYNILYFGWYEPGHGMIELATCDWHGSLENLRELAMTAKV